MSQDFFNPATIHIRWVSSNQNFSANQKFSFTLTLKNNGIGFLKLFAIYVNIST